jgi:ABC-type transporter MlaC component
LHGEFSRLKRTFTLAIASFMILFAAMRLNAETTDGPATAVVRQLLASVGKLRTTTDPKQKSALVSSIDSTLAVEKLSQQALGVQWSKLTTKQRKEFVSLITQLMERQAYTGAAQFFSAFKVEIRGEEVDGPRRIVKTTATQGQGGAVSVDYVLEKIGNRWMVVDIILDRQSMAASLTNQVQATLKAGSYDDLLDQLEARVEQSGAPPSK